MNRNDFKNPLIQSGAVLLFVFLLISIVAASGSEGLWGSIAALVSGLFSAILFVVALGVAILFSIAVIIGLYIAAVSFYSVDRGREIFTQVKRSLGDLSQRLSGIFRTTRKPAESDGAPASSAAAPADAAAAPRRFLPESVRSAWARSEKSGLGNEETAALKGEIAALTNRLSDLSTTVSASAGQIAALQQRLVEADTQADLEARVMAIEQAHQQFDRRVQEIAATIEAESAAARQRHQELADAQRTLRAELDSLHQKTSVPEVISGILSYLDTEKERDLVTEKAKEAISRGMTYSQIDDFFKDSLSPEIYHALAAHPRLTKDFLRSIKKKF